jgi:hypothetical protein
LALLTKHFDREEEKIEVVAAAALWNLLYYNA